jgi:hypothetical protein
MNVYWFDIEVAGPVTEGHVEALGDVLTAADGIDATVQAGEQGGVVSFVRPGADAVRAITSAIADVEAAGMTATGAAEDRVTVAEIADRAGVTTASVRYWVSGERGPGGFPTPRVPRQRASLYSWAEVAAWLALAGLGEVDRVAADTAWACVLIDAALIIRNGLHRLPRDDRELVTGLVG